MTTPMAPNGGVNFNTLTGTDPNDIAPGQLTIWNILLPKDLQAIGNEIWYGTESYNEPVVPHTEKILRMPGDEQPSTGGPGVLVTPGNSDVVGPAGSGGLGQLEGETKVKGGRASGSTNVMTSPQAILAQVAALSDPRNGQNLQKFVAIQKALASGPWGSVNVNGIFDSSTQKALVNSMHDWYMLSHGGQVGISFMDYLMGSGQIAQALGGGGTSGGTGLASGSGSTARPLDPAVIRSAAQTAAQSALGEGLSEKQLDAFVAQFQAQSSGQDAYTSSLHLPAIAMQYAQEAQPTEYKANQRQAFVDILTNMFAPSQSQRPNMTPVPQV